MQEHNHARQEIAAQLRQVRKEQGMTQERLAQKVKYFPSGEREI